jgi:hypothetical protein
MEMSKEKTQWIPEIMYEDADDGGLSSHIPFIQVPDGEQMPKMLFVFESRETGEMEPGPEGEELPVTELDLYQYANMNYLKSKMSWVEYDNLRFALGLEPLKTAAVKGAQVTSNVKIAVEGRPTKNALDNEDGEMENSSFKVNLKTGGFEN